MNKTTDVAFRETVARHGDRPFLCVPSDPARGYHQDGYEIDYANAAGAVDELIARYRDAGYGHGHRAAVALENRPEHCLHKLALNALGISCVPINPDYRPAEIAYLLDHCEADLILHLDSNADSLRAAMSEISRDVPMIEASKFADGPPAAKRPAPIAGPVTPQSEASLLYTSGTTGRPKGCILSHQYELMSGAWYADLGGLMALEPGAERVYNPLPLYHVNSGILSFFGMLLTGGCQIQPDRFHPRSWWRQVCETEATLVHYLGVVAPMLLNQPPNDLERAHSVRVGFGAGVEPSLHVLFEERFGFPLVEVWGMTEMVRVLADNHEPRQRGSHAMGRPQVGLEVRVVDDNDQEVPPDTVGEMTLRYSEETPRFGAFSGYLKDDPATEEAWRGGWLHTGDSVRQAADGMLYFVDRKKHIIRRSGENIAAAEVEATLQAHDGVAQVAVLATPDGTREEEVFACVVAVNESDRTETFARELFDLCFERLAYFKAPGWLTFVDDLPKTGSQKIQKHRIFGADGDPRDAAGVFDFRKLKRRR